MGVREALREATRAEHEKLDGLLGELRPFESAERYAVYLQGMQFLYEQFGNGVDYCAAQGGIAPRNDAMLEALRSDLESCSCEAARNGAKRDTETPLVPAAQWGAAYVLEGSAMGAQMLVREARKRLPAAIRCRFLEALAGEGVDRFRKFCAALETVEVDSQAAVDGAMQTFHEAIAWYRAHLTGKEAHLAT